MISREHQSGSPELEPYWWPEHIRGEPGIAGASRSTAVVLNMAQESDLVLGDTVIEGLTNREVKCRMYHTIILMVNPNILKINANLPSADALLAT